MCDKSDTAPTCLVCAISLFVEQSMGRWAKGVSVVLSFSYPT